MFCCVRKWCWNLCFQFPSDSFVQKKQQSLWCFPPEDLSKTNEFFKKHRSNSPFQFMIFLFFGICRQDDSFKQPWMKKKWNSIESWLNILEFWNMDLTNPLPATGILSVDLWVIQSVKKKYQLHPRSLTARPWKMVVVSRLYLLCLLGFCNFSGANC